MARWDGLDRRKFPRANYPCLVIIRNSDKTQDVILTHTENIGVGGVCVILKQDVKMFEPVEIELDLLDLGNHIKSEGKIVWNIRRKVDERKKPLFHDIGIEFKNLKQNDQNRLRDIVTRLVKNKKLSSY